MYLNKEICCVLDTVQEWFYLIHTQETTITEDKADDFKLSVQLPRTILKISAILFLCVSGN